jgi:hypothetical protein
MTDYKFFDSSPEAKAPYVRKVGHPKYPWKVVPVGKSFPVPKADIKFSTLRSLASKTGSELGKRFRVIDHEGDVYEVACLPMAEDEAIATSNNVVEALEKMDKGDGE